MYKYVNEAISKIRNRRIILGVDFLEELNEVQQAAVKDVNGPVLIVAGAGSGKTRVLTYRIAFILNQGLADPGEILSLTFTNKASREMRERIEKIVGTDARALWMGTFHSICSRILRIEAQRLNYTSNFSVFDDEDSLSTIKAILKDLNLDDKTFKPRIIFNHISAAKNKLWGPEEFELNVVHDTFTQVAARVYHLYEDRLFKANAMDFDDLIKKTIELFRQDSDVLYKYQHRFRYILVDEYQDTNHAQYMLTQMLASVHENICVVGDDAQSIYAFRGANIENILNFRKDYPEYRSYKLEQNYRSTQNIVNAANSIIKKNKKQIPKTVFSTNPSGELIRVVESPSDAEEARMIADTIRELKHREQHFNKDFAVLYRTNMQSRAIEDALRRIGIHYKVFGGISFYKRKEIKDMLAYFRLAINPSDSEALKRVINYPQRGIGKTTMDQLVVMADEKKISLWELISEPAYLTGRSSRAVYEFAMMIKAYGVEARSRNAFEAASYIARNCGILKDLHNENTTEGLERFENVQELLNSAKEFSEDPNNDPNTLDAFLAEISLFTSSDEKTEHPDYVSLMTIHTAKGLEFPIVFVAGMEEELFPSAMSMDDPDDIEEERRLFYVALTRAKIRLYLSHAKSRFRFGQVQMNDRSRFITEIPTEFLSFNKPQHTQATARTLSSQNQRRIYRPQAQSAFESDELSGLKSGQRVEHEKFGAGQVMQLDGQGTELKATILFDTVGAKVLLLKYAKLKIIS